MFSLRVFYAVCTATVFCGGSAVWSTSDGEAERMPDKLAMMHVMQNMQNPACHVPTKQEEQKLREQHETHRSEAWHSNWPNNFSEEIRDTLLAERKKVAQRFASVWKESNFHPSLVGLEPLSCTPDEAKAFVAEKGMEIEDFFDKKANIYVLKEGVMADLFPTSDEVHAFAAEEGMETPDLFDIQQLPIPKYVLKKHVIKDLFSMSAEAHAFAEKKGMRIEDLFDIQKLPTPEYVFKNAAIAISDANPLGEVLYVDVIHNFLCKQLFVKHAEGDGESTYLKPFVPQEWRSLYTYFLDPQNLSAPMGYFPCENFELSHNAEEALKQMQELLFSWSAEVNGYLQDERESEDGLSELAEVLQVYVAQLNSRSCLEKLDGHTFMQSLACLTQCAAHTIVMGQSAKVKKIHDECNPNAYCNTWMQNTHCKDNCFPFQIISLLPLASTISLTNYLNVAADALRALNDLSVNLSKNSSTKQHDGQGTPSLITEQKQAHSLTKGTKDCSKKSDNRIPLCAR